MFTKFFVTAQDHVALTSQSANELKEIDAADLDEVSGGIGTVTIASPTP